MKRIIAAMLLFVMLFTCTAMADDNVTDGSMATGIVMEQDEEGIMPLFTYLEFMSASLSIDVNGHAAWSGSACAPDHNVRITVYLQRSKNQAFWDNIQGQIKTVYDNGIAASERDLPKEEYYYRAKVIADVLDDNKNVIETVTLYSDSEFY